MKTCFVIQGFGKKTDYTDGRVLNLDASYEVIKEAVETAGLQCIRADEIAHSGTIDVPMYRMLLEADFVIADLSTYNVNAAFELGVRYALRPRTTILLAEEKFKNPFDVGHIAITRYQHLGEDVGSREAKRLREALGTLIRALTLAAEIDSPVYTFLPSLEPPTHRKNTPDFRTRSVPAEVNREDALVSATDLVAPSNPKELLDAALVMINPLTGGTSDFAGAMKNLQAVLQVRPNDPFVIQQLALATYKSKQPTAKEALLAAHQVLQRLDPATTNDPETLGLWGAIHKRLWELEARPEFLDEAIRSYERGFYLKQDHYNGINLAYLLNVRALVELKAGRRDEAIADTVQAKRVREEVIPYATASLKSAPKEPTKRFWLVATLWEAALGLGDATETERWRQEAESLIVPAWMQATRREQGARLLELQLEFARLRVG